MKDELIIYQSIIKPLTSNMLILEDFDNAIKQKVNLKRISKMYEFRSTFIHGKKDFPNIYNNNTQVDDIINFSNEIYDVVLTAKSILLCTIKKLILENKEELIFEYKIK